VLRIGKGSRMARSVRGGWLIALVAGIFALAMTGCSSSSSSSGGSGDLSPDATIFVQNFQYHDVPASFPSGIVTLLFQNNESFPIAHEMIPIALPSGKTAQDVIDAAKAPGEAGPASEDDWLHIGGDFGAIDTGAGLVEVLNLPPGTYAFACWQTGTQSGGENGPPHAAKGMVTQFTVT
jgi:hypothetical protein